MGRRSTRQEIRLSDADRARLERITRNPRSLRKHVWRARVVPEPGSGCGPAGTIRRTGVSKPTVRRRRDRFLALGVDGLLRDATRPPGKKPTPEARVKAPMAPAMSSPPPHARHRTVRAPAGKLGMVYSTVHAILKENGLGPHRVGTFRVSRDVVGLRVDPPDHAVVLPVDAETPAREAGPCLLAARDVATGKVVGRTVDRHRSLEFLAFLDPVAEGIASGTPVHVILDNVSSHRSARG